MKRLLPITIVVTVALSCAVPALVQAPCISPDRIEFEVPFNSSNEVEFTVYNFTGDLEISLEDMGLMEVVPSKLNITAPAEGTPIKIRFYGEPSWGEQIFKGTVRFLGKSGDEIVFESQVKATIHHTVSLPTMGGAPIRDDALSFEPPQEESLAEEVVVLPEEMSVTEHHLLKKSKPSRGFIS